MLTNLDNSKRLTRHDLVCDVLVAGGGPAGVPCAIAAARSGVKVILCHDRAVLGGNASSEIRLAMVGADCSGRRGAELETEAREGGIIEEIRQELCTRNPQRSASVADLVLYEKCRAEPNLTLLLETAVTAAHVEDGAIKYCIAERQSTEDAFRIKAGVFVDCTGDGRMGVEAGAPFREGRESKDEFGETLGQDAADNKRLGSTLLFQAKKHDRPMPFVAPPWARHFEPDDLKHRFHTIRGTEADYGYGFWWLEWGGCLDTVKDNATIRDELLALMLGVWDYVKNHDGNDGENWALEWFGFVPGKRESRRFVGQHTLTEDDVVNSTAFHDAIAFGGWEIDLHPPEGMDAPDQMPCSFHPVPHLYDIPLRACVSRDLVNLMFAGRNISATHVAFSSTRVMATCAAIGQGVGTAAGWAVRNSQSPAVLSGDENAMAGIQQQLLRDDCYLIGILNNDENDLARKARISASSEREDGAAVNVLSGQTRSVHGARGVPLSRTSISSHRWVSEDGLPQWLELCWDQTQRISQVQLVFDTGLHRALTQSPSDRQAATMLWGAPQPEIVRDYRLLIEYDNAWSELLNVTGNYQRRAVHHFVPTSVRALRIEVMTTNGIGQARIVEVRIY